MSTTFKSAAENYLRAKGLSRGTRNEYLLTIRKWERWGGGGPRDQRDVAGRHYLTKAEINTLYFATHKMGRPRGWDAPHPIGRYWRSALVVFLNYVVDTGTVWKSKPAHEPILWRHGVRGK